MLSVSDTPLSKPEQQRPALSQQADLSSVGVSAYGPSRHFVASQSLVAIGDIADIGRRWGPMPRWRMTQSGHQRVCFAAMQGYPSQIDDRLPRDRF